MSFDDEWHAEGERLALEDFENWSRHTMVGFEKFPLLSIYWDGPGWYIQVSDRTPDLVKNSNCEGVFYAGPPDADITDLT